MKPLFSSFTFYLKYIGLPLGFTFVMLRFFNRGRKRREALQGKVVVITGASSGIGEALAHAFYEQGSKVVLAARRESELNRVKNDLIAKKVVVVITGASSGIGEALAHAFYEQGSKVVLAARRESELNRVKNDLIAKKVTFSTEEPIVLPLDLSKLNQIETFVKEVYDCCGPIDILINNGGVSHRASVLQTNIEIFQQIMLINYFGSVALTKAVLPKMVERKAGHIIFVSSVQGLIAIPDRSAYAASKHAMQAFGDSLRAEMHQHNVNVTVISPGYVKTAVSLNAFTGDGSRHGVMDPSTEAGFAPEYVAARIMDTVVYKEKDLIISQFLPNLAIFIRHASPSLYFWLMARRANKI